jgi:hypothetical protein
MDGSRCETETQSTHGQVLDDHEDQVHDLGNALRDLRGLDGKVHHNDTIWLVSSESWVRRTMSFFTVVDSMAETKLVKAARAKVAIPKNFMAMRWS